MQAKWDEMFGVKEEKVVEEVKVKKLRKKAVVKKELTETGKKKAESKVKKPREQTVATRAGKVKNRVSAKNTKKIEKK